MDVYVSAVVCIASPSEITAGDEWRIYNRLSTIDCKGLLISTDFNRAMLGTAARIYRHLFYHGAEAKCTAKRPENIE